MGAEAGKIGTANREWKKPDESSLLKEEKLRAQNNKRAIHRERDTERKGERDKAGSWAGRETWMKRKAQKDRSQGIKKEGCQDVEIRPCRSRRAEGKLHLR